jgi:predicted ATP-binding protein involved in virulence
MNSLIRLDELTLSNYRCFKSFTLKFEPDLTVLIARNGSGKTSVLDAVAAAFGPFVKTLNKTKGGNLRHEDVRLVQNPSRALQEMEAQYPLVLSAKGLVEDQVFDWKRELRSPGSHTKYAEDWVVRDYAFQLRDGVQNHRSVLLPIISYYGTGRLWGERRLSRQKKRESTSRLRGYADCLSPSSSYRDFAAWFKKLHLVIFEEREKPTKPEALEEAQAQLSAVSYAVDQALAPTGWNNLKYRHAAGGIVASHPQHGELMVDQLSDGLRNMIGMVADIAYRMVSLNPHLGKQAVKETPGIVLIDEVDMHLHPEWQQVVLESLRNALPQVQFIVTTHSPQVLTTVKNQKIRILVEENGSIVAKDVLQNAYAKESRTALEDIMNVRSRPPIKMAKSLEEYQDLIEKGEIDSTKAMQLRRELEAQYGAASEEMQLADLVIARWKALRRGKDSKS